MTDLTPARLIAVLEESRRKLLETGTRNRLVHVNRENQRANCLNIINERSNDVFGILRVDGRKMRFKAMGKDRKIEDPELRLEEIVEEEVVSKERYTDSVLETPLGPEALQKRLLRIATAAKTAEEEQGVNILYLAMGFLNWRESEHSEIERNSPLILMPVSLVRNERTSTYDVLCRDEDFTTNLPLQERLKQDFGINLPEVEEDDGWKPEDYFERVREVIASKEGWKIDNDGMQLGFFSFAKLLMHRDLAPENWPDGELDRNPLLKKLIAQGFEHEGEIFGDGENLDDVLDPEDIIQIVDADASQTKVIEEVRKGSSLVVQGPPGTGKSQTISNIIAAAVHDGKKVLFVAEKMAALSVVHQRLVKAGLRDVCLELHSRSSNKKALAQELGRTLASGNGATSVDTTVEELRNARNELNMIANMLHTQMPSNGDSAFNALGELSRFLGRGVTPPVIPLEDLEKLDRKSRREIAELINLYVEARNTVGSPEAHPFYGVEETELQPTDVARLRSELREAVDASKALLQDASEIAEALNVSPPETCSEISKVADVISALGRAPANTADYVNDIFQAGNDARLVEALSAGEIWALAHQKGENTFNTAAWNAGLEHIRNALVRGQGSILSRLFGPYRKASTEFASLLNVPLPKRAEQRLALLTELLEIQQKRKTLSDEENYLSARLGEHWRGERTPFAQIKDISSWLAHVSQNSYYETPENLIAALANAQDTKPKEASIREQVSSVVEALAKPIQRLNLKLGDVFGSGDDIRDIPLKDVMRRFEAMEVGHERYPEWTGLKHSTNQLVSRGAQFLVDAVDLGKVPAEGAKDEFLYACAEARWKTATASRPELSRLANLDRNGLVSTFRDLETRRIGETQSLILARHAEQIPKGSAGQMGVIRGEIGRKRGHKPVRWVMKNAGEMVQRVKPVFLMSPISVAQFLPPGSLSFDLLVIDEASQIKPEDAFGVIARAKQIVVVGDEKQLPPTSFFDRLIDSADEEDDDDEELLGASAADMESILTACTSRGMRQRMLEWHYRSRDPSLIRVSNREFYEDNLVLPPSPLEKDDNYGFKFQRVAGVYSRGKSGPGRTGTNKIEAQAVVQEMARHARECPNLSLGIVAFSKSQATMLTEVLEHARRNDPVLDAFLREGQREDVFVKNIENVQGDERDVIIISVGYGPNEPNGRLPSMSFGPVNGEGGERRLNVLFTRSRIRCTVFASFDPGDIDPARTTREGPKVLKRFLEFAKTGILDDRAPTGLGADSPFEEDVAEVIRGLGYLVDLQVGSAGFRIDLGVRHPDRPGQYIAAVECDGATYHSALWARERDRLRQDILENLGWSFHRIWSTDWFYRRAQEIERLKLALEDAHRNAGDGITVQGANEGREIPEESDLENEENFAPEGLDIDHLQLKAPLYRRADVFIASRSKVEPHEAPLGQLADLVKKIVEQEGPIHTDELARRISAAFGKTKAGRRIMEVARDATQLAIRQEGGALRRDGEFVVTQQQIDEPPVRDRSEEAAGVVKAGYLPPIEIRAAAKTVREECGEMDLDELVRATAKLMGFKRVGPDLNKVITDCLTT